LRRITRTDSVQPIDSRNACPECEVPMVDAGDELVCPRCGIANEKEVIEVGSEGPRKAPRYGSYRLGSFMGERKSHFVGDSGRYQGVAGSADRYGYLKTLSNRTGSEDGAQVDCSRIIERVGEKLRLPLVAVDEATRIAKKVVASPHPHRRLAVAPVSAFALISACKINSISSVDSREIIRAHCALGRRVTSSSVMRVGFHYPLTMVVRRPEDFVAPILARLSGTDKLATEFSNEAGLSVYLRTLRDASIVALCQLKEEARWGRRPSTLAATAIYSAERILALREGRKTRISQREVAECVRCSEYTVREQCSSCFRTLTFKLTPQRKPSQIDEAEAKRYLPVRQSRPDPSPP
jgi:transcription initiation factor TFIIIB Brf1 subunit/transcription initiation factor TFIIB